VLKAYAMPNSCRIVKATSMALEAIFGHKSPTAEAYRVRNGTVRRRCFGDGRFGGFY